MNPYLDVLRKYAVFSGRASRSQYWGFFLINMAVGLGLAIFDGIIGTVSEQGYGILSVFYGLAVLIPSIAVFMRRLHDTGRSAWWSLIIFLPLVNIVCFLLFTLSDSQPGLNKYGPNPKGIA